MKAIPEDSTLEAVKAFATEGYNFVSNRCENLNSDIFKVSILSEEVICMRGRNAAEVFYNNDHFERHDVAPNFTKDTLFGHGAIQNMDGEAHRHRKKMFMNLMTFEGIKKLIDITNEKLHEYAERWQHEDQVVLIDEFEKLLCEAVCEWTGVPLQKDEVEQRAEDLGYLIEGVGSLGIKHIKGRAARDKSEKWIEELIEQVRINESIAEDWPKDALHHIAFHRDLEGSLLDKHTAAVELLNILRPVVAVARYMVFAALALHQHPEHKQKIRDNEDYVAMFMNEVRRFYPFFPFQMARVKKEFEWEGYPFPLDTYVLLDFYGTNHHPQLWDKPRDFNPERFQNKTEDAFDLIPQGGGDYYQHHRCPGEEITKHLINNAVKFLVHSLKYEVPDQDLEVSLTRLPAIPESGFIIKQVTVSGDAIHPPE